MSNALAIATTTVALGDVIQTGIAGVSGAKVTTVRPDEKDATDPEPEANVFLYQVSPSAAHRNADLPTRATTGELRRRPQLGLELHYLVSFYGDESILEPQRLLGGAVTALHARPQLTAGAIEAILDAAAGAGLADPRHYLGSTDLGEQAEHVTFAPMLLNLEEFSRLWSTLFRVPYVLSVAYRASVVLVETDVTPRPALPVRAPIVAVVPIRRPDVERVEADDPGTPILAGTTIVLRGRRLRGDVTRVRVGDAIATPDAGDVTDTAIRVPLTTPPFTAGALRAGVQGAQVLHLLPLGEPPVPHEGVESAVVPFVLRPDVTGATVADVEGTGAGPRSATVTVQVQPPIAARQRVVLLLDAVAGEQAYAFRAPQREQDADPVEIPIAGVAAGTYLVRIQVDGAESLLDVAAPPGPFTGPTLTVP